MFSDSVLLTSAILKDDLFPRRGIKVFAFLPERQKILLLSLAQTWLTNYVDASRA
jgi:hypothetical protein